jgi:GNAT superfamily N-acetyltransferase
MSSSRSRTFSSGVRGRPTPERPSPAKVKLARFRKRASKAAKARCLLGYSWTSGGADSKNILVRKATRGDVLAITGLLSDYMHEIYSAEWRGEPIAIERDGFGVRFQMAAAACGPEIVAFIAWTPSYDLHHSMAGGEVLDLSVAPPHRHRGIAALLIALVCKEVFTASGSFLRGGAVNSVTAIRLYSRFAPAFGNDYTLSGRAFRCLAEFDGTSARELVSTLPKKAWNFEA